MEPLYDVCFAGQLLDGQELHSVRNKIQKLFKANPETLQILFSGKTQILKHGCDKVTSLKYKKALEAAGAKPIIRACKVTNDPMPADKKTFHVAPVGTDVISPEERTVSAHTEVDVSHLNLASVGTMLGEVAQRAHSTPDTSHLSMGETGEDIPNLPDTRTATTPNTNGISLAPKGGDFSDCAPPNSAYPELDLSAMELAPAGVYVLEEQYKKKEQGSAPDTSHLSTNP